MSHLFKPHFREALCGPQIDELPFYIYNTSEENYTIRVNALSELSSFNGTQVDIDGVKQMYVVFSEISQTLEEDMETCIKELFRDCAVEELVLKHAKSDTDMFVTVSKTQMVPWTLQDEFVSSMRDNRLHIKRSTLFCVFKSSLFPFIENPTF